MKAKVSFSSLFAVILFPATRVMQDEQAKSSFSAGADFYTNYIWRGQTPEPGLPWPLLNLSPGLTSWCLGCF
jgi:hypothetical protein